ncbi:hypothetical protein ANCCAN_09541 [Ancylostoma caninum]|uniref:ABC-2 type transporter transmembrane domain-containing protein n=1 Tax=Ancylostoma caninum TaxID=29170 RepID=A0A368GJD8_ANCCA|nr:hypothetical protein ANCCAN_09541 [Ancylostoma caninum]
MYASGVSYHIIRDEKGVVRSAAARLGAQPNLLVDTVGDVTSYVLALIPKIGPRFFGSHYPLAFQREFVSDKAANFTVYFNNFAYTTPPLAISLVDTMIMSEVLKKPITLMVSNHPFPPVLQDALENRNYSSIFSSLLGVAVIISVSHIMAAYSQFIITERIKNSKHMQILSGLQPWIYWITAFAWDIICFFAQIAVFVGIFYAFNIEPYTEHFTTVLILLLAMSFYAWTTIPFIYLISFVFDSASRGFTVIFIYNMASGLIGSIFPILTQQWSNENLKFTSSVILSFLFPTYSICNIFTMVCNITEGEVSTKSHLRLSNIIPFTGIQQRTY